MKDIVDKVKNSDTRVQLVILAIVVLVVIFIGFNKFGEPTSNDLLLDHNDEMGEHDDEIMDEMTGGIVFENSEMMEDSNTPVIAQGATKIKLALLAGAFYDDVNLVGKKRGCDTVVMVEQTIPNSPAVLNGALSALFSKQVQTDFLPGNFISTQDNLDFEKATIENGVAKVYLTGEEGPVAGDCDADRTKIQVEETALQFSTVSSVEVYLNGEKI